MWTAGAIPPFRIYGSGVELLAWIALVPITAALAIIDVRSHRLPNSLVLIAFAFGVVGLGVKTSGRHALTLFTIYFLLHLLSRGGIGMGDVKLASVVGLYLGQYGWSAVAFATWTTFISAGAVGAVGVAMKRLNLRSHIPFGPFMVAGLWVSVLISSS